MSTVQVLTPNGRRQNVKVTPSTTILQILEEVCQKHEFCSEEYDLKHHNRILDITMMFRFTGLPNNAKLEMVTAAKKRIESEVVLGVQLEDGSRLSGSFKPLAMLCDVLENLCPEEANKENAVVVYMRKEIFGDNIKTTSLKSLGLTSGRAIIRLVHKDPAQLKVQANVSAVIPSRATHIDDDDIPKASSTSQIQPLPMPTSSGSILSRLIKDKKEADAAKSTESKPLVDEQMDTEVLESPPQNATVGIDNKKAKVEDSTPSDEVTLIEEEPDVIILGERNAVVYSLDAATPSNMDNNIPDSFFDLTVNDVRSLLRDLKKQREGLDDAPLLTAKLRELEESNHVLNKMGRYKKAVIRIQFPERMVLQGIFNPTEQIKDVQDFVRTYLKDDTIDFYLFTTPPKNTLNSEERLIECHCVPTVLLHFGCEQKFESVLKEELADKLSSPSAALIAASKSRNLISMPHNSSDQNPGCSTSIADNKPKLPTNFQRSSAASDVKVPKWFKPIGK